MEIASFTTSKTKTPSTIAQHYCHHSLSLTSTITAIKKKAKCFRGRIKDTKKNLFQKTFFEIYFYISGSSFRNIFYVKYYGKLILERILKSLLRKFYSDKLFQNIFHEFRKFYSENIIPEILFWKYDFGNFIPEILENLFQKLFF